MVCVLEIALLLFLYMIEVGLVGGNLGNYHKPTLGVTIAPPDECGPKRRWWGCGRTWAGFAHHCLRVVASGWAWVLATSLLGLDLQGKWAFLLFPLIESMLCFL